MGILPRRRRDEARGRGAAHRHPQRRAAAEGCHRWAGSGAAVAALRAGAAGTGATSACAAGLCLIAAEGLRADAGAQADAPSVRVFLDVLEQTVGVPETRRPPARKRETLNFETPAERFHASTG
ncbi:hypothetical protein CBM2626_B160024 [Cupriavidus taiwanensis]|nr:hypothetical protein CBM2626_B160024 [Cupriavidus taiwanensis]